MPEQGRLAAALAKAQAAFPAIERDKTVTVQTKAGSSYTFKYAPLDSILAKTRGPLSSNGLAILQLLDEDYLVTSLMHESGEILSGRTPIPPAEGIQAYGSAITYLRRYAIQALLGIAAEEDDDGNQHAGNRATFGGSQAKAPTPNADGSLIGMAELGSGSSDFAIRSGPKGDVLSFRLSAGRQKFKVVAEGAIATALAAMREDVLGKTVTCWGDIREETFTPSGAKKPITYYVLLLDRISTPTFTIPGPDEPESVPTFSDDEDAALTAAGL